jgi:hypothetical protein
MIDCNSLSNSNTRYSHFMGGVLGKWEIVCRAIGLVYLEIPADALQLAFKFKYQIFPFHARNIRKTRYFDENEMAVGNSIDWITSK